MPNKHMIDPRSYVLDFRYIQNGDLENKTS